MATTFTLISTITVGSGGAASIDFTSIPNTYTDLCLKTSLRTDRTSITSDMILQFNGDTSAAYSFRRIYGSGSGTGSDTLSAGSTNGLSGFADGASATSSTFGNTEIYIPNYAGSTQKSWSTDGVNENNATTAYAGLYASLWTGTSAINRVTIKDYNSANFVQYSSASLYGILKA
jgi:hypothetical protein